MVRIYDKIEINDDDDLNDKYINDSVGDKNDKINHIKQIVIGKGYVATLCQDGTIYFVGDDKMMESYKLNKEIHDKNSTNVSAISGMKQLCAI